MVYTTWRYAQRPVMLRFPYINKFSIISYISRNRRLPHRYSTLYAPMTDSVDACNPDPTTSLASDDSLDPRKYTSGRWLRRDELERNSRILNIDFDALRHRVIELCPGATSIARYEKKEGGYNRIFIFTCDNARRVVARLPTSVAGPARLTTNSEVATITYVQSNTTVPTPKILDWSDDPSNAIGSEYIIMEHATGVQLHQKWPKMSGEQQIACIRAICISIQQIAAIDFPAYGSLYFADAPLHSTSTLPLTQGFCIGPHCGTRYWDCNVGEARFYNSTKPNRGPWSHLTAYCDGLIDTGLSRLPSGPIALADKPPFHGSVAAHTRLLNDGRGVIQKLAKDPRIQGAATATLCHADLHKRNIFVSDDDPSVITNLIDWQSSSIEPAFEYAGYVPDFAAPMTDASPEEKPAEIQTALCKQAFDACLQGLIPKLYAARALDDDLLRPFRYCHRTWRDGAAAFRHELIDISSRWGELGLAGACPYALPTSVELLEHQKEFQSFRIANDLKRKLIDLLDTTPDGWVPTDSWEVTEVAHQKAFGELVQAIRSVESIEDQSMNEEDLRRIWPFDIR